MEQDTKTYQDHIEKQLAQYGALIFNHILEVERMMKTESIPIYIRWQELRATIRAFETLAYQTDKSLTFLYRMHSSKKSEQN